MSSVNSFFKSIKINYGTGINPFGGVPGLGLARGEFSAEFVCGFRPQTSGGPKA